MTVPRFVAFFIERKRWRRLLGVSAIGISLSVSPATQAWQPARVEQVSSETIPASEFSRLVRELSEADGFFRSDNFISNETSYLHVVDKMRRLGATGGAYVGVGPDQNFTYIAKIRPQIAFIVDIRRQAMIQHLMFKAIFAVSENRLQFLSRLFSKLLNGGDVPGRDSPVDQILKYVDEAPSTEEVFNSNLAGIRDTIENEFQFPLSERDRSSLSSVYGAFRNENLNIQYRSGSGNWGGPQWGYFPTLKDLIMQQDLHGKLGNFLTCEDDYEFLRKLHRNNRIIPVVGDFAGPKALAGVGEYLKKHGHTVTVFYTSNVEQYLFANGSFGTFVENVRKLPITEWSLFIRAFPNMREPHPARVSPHRLTTLLQKMTVFLDDFDHGLYQDYWALVTTHFIQGDEP
jgi:hypothetical protein